MLNPTIFFKRILGFAGQARRGFEGQDHGAEPAPGDHAAQEAVVFAHGTHGFHHRAGQQAEVGRAGGDVCVADAIEQPVELGRGPAFEGGNALFFDALGQDHVVAGTSQVEHLAQHFRGVLPVTVHGDHVIGVSLVQASGQGGLVAEITAQFEHFHAPVGGSDAFQERLGLVGRAIVDVKNGKGIRQAVDGLAELPVEPGHNCFFIVGGDDDIHPGKSWRIEHAPLR